MNLIALVGRLTRDPELRTTTSGKSVASFSLAVRKRIKPTNPDDRDADFFNVEVWGQTATYVTGYLTKGSTVSVTGRMESRKYTDKEGNNREIWTVTADQVNGLDRRPDGTTPATPKAAAPAQDDGDYDPFAE